MTPLVFLGNLPSTYYSLKNIGTTIIILYVTTMIVIITYPEPILCHNDKGTYHS